MQSGLSCLRQATNETGGERLWELPGQAREKQIRCWKCLKAPELPLSSSLQVAQCEEGLGLSIPSWSIAFLIVFVVFLVAVTSVRIVLWCCCGHGDFFERSKPFQSLPFTKI